MNQHHRDQIRSGINLVVVVALFVWLMFQIIKCSSTPESRGRQDSAGAMAPTEGMPNLFIHPGLAAVFLPY